MLYAKNTQLFLDTPTSRYLLVNGARIYRMKTRSLLNTLRLRFPVGLLSLRHTQVNKKYISNAVLVNRILSAVQTRVPRIFNFQIKAS